MRKHLLHILWLPIWITSLLTASALPLMSHSWGLMDCTSSYASDFGARPASHSTHGNKQHHESHHSSEKENPHSTQQHPTDCSSRLDCLCDTVPVGITGHTVSLPSPKFSGSVGTLISFFQFLPNPTSKTERFGPPVWQFVSYLPPELYLIHGRFLI